LELKRDKITERAENKGEAKGKAPFAAKAVLVGAIAGAAVAACTPDVNITVTPYDPYAEDAGTGEACIATCEPKSGVLREPGNTAGTNELQVGGAVLRFTALVDSGPTKAATLELEGCEGEKPADSLTSGEVVTLTLNSGESADVIVESMEYDGAGLKIEVSVTPLCESADAGIDGNGGAGGDGGAGGSG
jgi:hypothetical protein